MSWIKFTPPPQWRIYASLNRVSIGSDNGLSPIRCQAIIWTSAGLLSTGHLGTNFSEILAKIQNFSFTKMHLKISSANRRPFCPGGDELRWCPNHEYTCKDTRSPFVVGPIRRHAYPLFPMNVCAVNGTIMGLQRPFQMIWWTSLIAKFMGPTCDPSGTDRTQVGPCWSHGPCYLSYN